jgi:signal transduction histidine kinase
MPGYVPLAPAVSPGRPPQFAEPPRAEAAPMKSIRFTLIVYFLVLLAAAQGAASWLIYQSGADVHREMQEVKRELLDREFGERSGDEERRFKNELLDHAREVAVLLSRQSIWDKVNTTRLLALGMMNPAQGHLTGLVWLAEQHPARMRGPSIRGHIVWSLLAKEAGQITIADDTLPKFPGGDTGYYQINAEWNPPPWRSRSLGGAVLPFDPDEFSPTEFPIDWKYDEQSVGGRRVRRVMFKVPVNPQFIFRPRIPQQRPIHPPTERGGERGRGPDRGGDRGRPSDRGPDRAPEPNYSPWIVIHVAREPGSLEATLAELESAREAALREHQQEADDSLAALRRRLLTISGGTFLAVLAGGLLIGRIGLAPLGRLCEAVARVSPKDFKLPLDDTEPLPSELAPIRDCLQHTLGELHKVFEREKQAAADISHELRTPVASILTTVEVALKKQRPAEEYRETLQEVRVIGKQMRQLVERLMALARLDAGSDRVRPRPADVAEVVKESAALVRPLAAERGLELRVHCPKPVTVKTDPDKLREVLINLLHNAVQYNRPNGSIDVTAERDNGWLDLSVTDTGIGIKPEALGRVFERFYRADTSRHADDLHAGLGLSIVKGYVGLLGGTVAVESQLGQGSTFRVRLPAA